MVTTLQGVSITQLIEQQVAQSPDAIAVICQEEQMTYEELNQKANQLAHYLRSLGVKPETLVGICVDRSAAMVVALLGILKAGGAYVPLDPTYPAERLAFTIEDSQMSVLITQNHLSELLPLHQVNTVYLDREWETISQQSIDNLINKVRPDNLAYVIYTSGSTGKPKGVAIEHRNTAARIKWAKEFFSSSQLQGVLASTSLCFDLSVFELFVTLSSGGTVIIAQNALQLPDLPAAYKVTLINTVPSAILALYRTNSIPTSVNTINLAGEPLQNTLVQKLYQLDHIQYVFNLYGPSEDTTYSTVALMPRGSNEIPSIGQPLPNTQIHLIEPPTRRKDDPLKVVPPGTPGEIYIGGDGVARGYLNQPELTAERFIPNPFRCESEARLYKTGDLAVYLPDGNLKFLGRIDHQVKIRGFRVELGDVEAILSQHPGIRETTVVAKDDISGGKRLIAYVVPTTDQDKSEIATASNLSTLRQLQQWKKVWSATYGEVSDDFDPTSDSVGWVDSFTGLPIPLSEVQEWIDYTVERILAFQPRRVLEIGCGRGMLLFRLAPHCTQYFGTDISAEAIRIIEWRLKHSKQDWASHVTVAQRTAHELEEFEPESFDTIVINSVIQYFPSIEYLVQVLEKAVRLVQPGGQIFIGDIRSLPLLEAFHTGIQMKQLSDETACDQLQQHVRERILQDKELVLHPDFFQALRHRIPQISHIQTQLKQGQSNDELTRFRSDVILHIKTPVKPISQYLCLDWQEELSIHEICQFLKDKKPDTLRVRRVPNPRIFSEVKAAELLASSNQPPTVGGLRKILQSLNNQVGVHPDCFWNLARNLPYSVHVTWSEFKHDGTYDVLFQNYIHTQSQDELAVITEAPIAVKSWQSYGNNPLKCLEKSNLVPQLRAFLKEKLPDYMIPTSFVVMDALPLTLNGKIDRRSLPDPKKERPILQEEYVAPSRFLEQQLVQIWSRILDIEQIGIYDSFFELGGHSLLTTQLIAQIEAELQIELPLFYLLREPTIAGLIKAIHTVQQSGNAVEEKTPANPQADTILDPTIQPKVPFIGLKAEPEYIFLTGATGFLGGFLLHELLQQTHAEIYCLVRASTLEAGRQKLQANLKRYMLWNGELDSRIIPVLGDLSQPRLGIDDSTFHELASKLDLIYHCGALVNLVYPYTALRAANVLGTQEVLRLASHSNVIPVHYISTIDVLKPLTFSENRIIKENEHPEHSQEIDKGYTQTKWVSEKLIMAAQSRGIPVCIYRPGMLTGHSRTGASQTNDLMCRIIKGIIQLGAAPDLDQSINMTPVDYASQAIAYLSRQEESFGKAFHILNPQPLPWDQLIQKICKLGYTIRVLSYDQWQAELLKLESSTQNVLAPLSPLFTEKDPKTQLTYLETFLMTAQAFDCRNTSEGLLRTSVACPPINTNLLDNYFYYFNQISFL